MPAGEYADQTDVFFRAPEEYLRTRFPQHVDRAFPRSPRPFSPAGARTSGARNDDWAHAWPQYVVAFGALLHTDGVAPLLAARGYAPVWAREWGWEGDGRRRGGVVVLRVVD